MELSWLTEKQQITVILFPVVICGYMTKQRGSLRTGLAKLALLFNALVSAIITDHCAP